jgi:predicted esterase
LTATIEVNRDEGSAHLRVTEAEPERVEQDRELGLVDAAIAVMVDALEAIAERVSAHWASVRCFRWRENARVFACILSCACACRGAPAAPAPAAASSVDGRTVDSVTALGLLHPSPSASAVLAALPPLHGEWLERLPTSHGVAVATLPLGATTASPVVLGVHGAGDRPDWSCGGWRLASQSSAFVVCPQGSALSPTTFAWSSAQQLGERSDAALEALAARYGAYVASGPLIYAGFSQGATLSQKYLLAHAARFPIAILAEGGYGTWNDARFASAFRAGGGRRLVLVCGTPGCFTHARRAVPPLEHAGLQVLVVGDDRAGHNLNDRMQRALQEAWPEISAPFPAAP